MNVGSSPAQTNGKRVNIVLPPLSQHPIGGYKVHYQLADALSRSGCFVSIVHINWPSMSTMSPRLRYLRHRAWRVREVPWYQHHEGVRVIESPHLNSLGWPPAQLTVLTGWQTSSPQLILTERMGKVAQVVYDYELWAAADPEERLNIEVSLARHDIPKVASSRAVVTMLAKLGVTPVATIPPGHDVPVVGSQRMRGRSVLLPLRRHPSKGSEFAIEVMNELHARDPTISFVSFGDLPERQVPTYVDWRGFIDDGDLAELRRSTGAFFLPSQFEGFGLTALEAMAAGLPVVSADNGGINDFGERSANCLIVDFGDVEEAVVALASVLGDSALKERLIKSGLETAALRTSRAQVHVLAEKLLSM